MGPNDQRAARVEDWIEAPTGLEARRDDLDLAADQRAELARILTGVEWPATAAKLAVAAVGNDADADLIARLRALPARRRYPAVGAVWTALGGPDVEEVAREEAIREAPTTRPPQPKPALAPAPEAPAPRQHRFGFAFAPLFLPFAVPLGITPRTAWVDVDDDRVEVRFGPWVLRTDRSNLAGAEVTGPYSLPKVLGPPHLSFADRGVTFATNQRHGVCLRFHEPVAGLLPAHRRWVVHPSATVTVADPEGLVAALVS